MRPYRILGLAFMLITGPVMLESCGGGCGGWFSNGEDVYYDIDDMALSVERHSGAAAAPPWKLSDHYFQIVFEVTRISRQETYGSALYACSPAPTISNQKISAVVVTSNRAFTTDTGEIVAGESLNFMFKVSSWTLAGDPISDLINN